MVMVANARPPEAAMDRLTISRQIIELTGQVKNEGIHIEYQINFGYLREVVASIPDKRVVSAMFDVKKSDIGSENGFWIKGTDQSGRVVHVQAIRFDDLTGTTLARHWDVHRSLYQPPEMKLDLGKTIFASAPAAHEITGLVCYHGELWIHKGLRRKHLASRLANIAMLIALTRFRPDYIYCLITPKVVRTGLSVRNGYLHLHPHGIRWHLPQDQCPFDEYLVWMSGTELALLTDRPQSIF